MNYRTSYLVRGFVAALVVIALTSQAKADQALGKAKVQAVCAVCHGVDGIGKNPDVPNLAGESPQYIQKQLKAFRSGGRQHEQMSIIAKDLTDSDIANVADWFSTARVLFTPINDDGTAGTEEVLAEGWLNDSGEYIGRPVGLAQLRDGSILVSDDLAGAIYRISYSR